MVKEVRLHGRGGMGTVKAAEVLVYAAVMDGKYANSIPFFGFERQGAPVSAFVRISEQPIRPKNRVYTPDIVLVMDPTILHGTNVFEGLSGDGLLVINTGAQRDIPLPECVKKTASLDASKIATEILGRPLTNTVMLGAFVKATGLVSLEQVAARASELWGEKNGLCVKAGFEQAVLSER